MILMILTIANRIQQQWFWMCNFINKYRQNYRREKMKMAPYSPFNRTYKYMCLQNQLIHNKNKLNVKGLVDSNLLIQHNCSHTLQAPSKTHIDTRPLTSSKSSYRSKDGTLRKQPLTIHKNSKYDSRRKLQINEANAKINRKISQTKCRVIPYKETQKQFANSVIYKGIAMRFDQFAKNKQLIYFPNSSLTSTLANFDMSTSRYLCRPQSARKHKN